LKIYVFLKSGEKKAINIDLCRKKEMSDLSDEGSKGDLAKGRKKAIIFYVIQCVSRFWAPRKYI